MFIKSKKLLSLWAVCAVSTLWATVSHATVVQRWKTAEGTRVALVESRVNPILDIQIDFDAGRRRDEVGQLGVAHLTAAALLATQRFDEEAFSDAVSDIAATINTVTDEDRASLRVRTLSRSAEKEKALALVADVLSQPVFPDALLQRVKSAWIDGLRQQKIDPASVASRLLSQRLYPSHPYGFAAKITEEDVNRLSREQVRAFWKRHYQPQFATVTLVGDVDRAEAERIVQRLLRGAPRGAESLPAVATVLTPLEATYDWQPHSASQASIQLGMPVLRRHDPDYYPLLVGNYILGGGGFDSRLMQELRDKSGLTYGISSHMSVSAERAGFVISMSTRHEAAAAALQKVQRVLADFVKSGPSAAELTQAQNNLAGGFPLRIDNNRKVLGYVSTMAFYDLPDDFLTAYPAKIRAVTVAQIRDAFQRRVASQKWATVVVGGERSPFEK